MPDSASPDNPRVPYRSSGSERIALVTGASRGIGRGVALALADSGATVYLTARTVSPRESGLPGSLYETAAAVAERGGIAIPIACDHADDTQVAEAFARVAAEHGRLDVLVNNVFAVPDDASFFGTPFWEQPVSQWDLMHRVGLRSHYVAARHAVPLMLERGDGLIANISSFGGAGYQINVAYGVGKAGVDRLAADMAHDLRPHGITAVSLWPGVVRTERLVHAGESLPWSLEGAQSPLFTGRAVVALADDPGRIEKTGRTLIVSKLAKEYGFRDEDESDPQ